MQPRVCNDITTTHEITGSFKSHLLIFIDPDNSSSTLKAFGFLIWL